MPAQLVALSDGPNIMLDKPILLLGRHAECDIQLNSRKVSRRHCCIAQVSTYLVVRDLGSTNGIRINGVRVLEGRLKGGDELTVGNFRYHVTLDDKPAPPPARPPAKPVKGRNGIPIAKPATTTGTESDEDGLLESCDDPVMLGKIAKKRDATKPADPPSSGNSPMFPENVNLKGDSSEGKQPPATSH